MHRAPRLTTPPLVGCLVFKIYSILGSALRHIATHKSMHIKYANILLGRYAGRNAGEELEDFEGCEEETTVVAVPDSSTF